MENIFYPIIRAINCGDRESGADFELSFYTEEKPLNAATNLGRDEDKYWHEQYLKELEVWGRTNKSVKVAEQSKEAFIEALRLEQSGIKLLDLFSKKGVDASCLSGRIKIIGDGAFLEPETFTSDKELKSFNMFSKNDLEGVSQALETFLFAAYMVGQENKTTTPDRNFKSWFEDNKILDHLYNLLEEYTLLKIDTFSAINLSYVEFPENCSENFFNDLNEADRNTWLNGFKKCIKLLTNNKIELPPKDLEMLKKIEESEKRFIGKDFTIRNGIKIENVHSMGMDLKRWTYKGCKADFGVSDEFATLYVIESKEHGKGQATYVLKEAKAYYEGCGLKFGGSVALNDTMKHIYKKLNIEEYAG